MAMQNKEIYNILLPYIILTIFLVIISFKTKRVSIRFLLITLSLVLGYFCLFQIEKIYDLIVKDNKLYLLVAVCYAAWFRSLEKPEFFKIR